MRRLKNCPFCDSEPIGPLAENEDFYSCSNSSCPVSEIWLAPWEWNLRPGEDKVREEVFKEVYKRLLEDKFSIKWVKRQAKIDDEI